MSTRRQNVASKKYKRLSRRITADTLRRLGRKGETLADVAKWAGMTETQLARDIARKPTWRAAWDRGRLLHAIAHLSRLPASFAECASDLAMPADAFAELVTADPQASEIWRAGRMQARQAIGSAMYKEAAEGNAAVAAKLLDRLREGPGAGVGDDGERGSRPLGWIAAELGMSKSAVEYWLSKGAPRHPDGTFATDRVVDWLRTAMPKGQQAKTGPDLDAQIKKARHEQLDLANRKQRGDLLDRTAVIAGIVARYQVLVAALASRPARLAAVLAGRPADEITETLTADFADLRRGLAEVPPELRLPPAAAARWRELIAAIEQEHRPAA